MTVESEEDKYSDTEILRLVNTEESSETTRQALTNRITDAV